MKFEFPVLETERLILRQIKKDDAHVLFEYWSDFEVTKYMNIEPFSNINEAEYMIDLLNNLFIENKAMRWAIVEKKSNNIIGTCGYNSGLDKESYKGEFGYDLGKIYWGKGFMKEAAEKIIKFGFENLNLNRIEAFVVPENHGSINLLNKLKFKNEGLLRQNGYYKDKFWDEYIFSLLKNEWNA